jgi:hypothetical protein
LYSGSLIEHLSWSPDHINTQIMFDAVEYGTDGLLSRTVRVVSGFQDADGNGQPDGLVVNTRINNALSPDWSFDAQCPNPDDPYSVSPLLAADDSSQIQQNYLVRKACLWEYRGAIFAPVFHETSFNTFVGTDEIVDFVSANGLVAMNPDVGQFIDPLQGIQNNFDFRYLFARAAINGIVNNAYNTLNPDEPVNPVLYLKTNFSCTSSLNVCLGGGLYSVEHHPTPPGLAPSWNPNVDGPACQNVPPPVDYEQKLPDDTVQVIDLYHCVDRNWYNRVLDTWGRTPNHAYWLAGYRDIVPEIIAAIHDEATGFDILNGGQYARSPNVSDLPEGSFQTDIDIVNQSIVSRYEAHLDILYNGDPSACAFWPIYLPTPDPYPLRALNYEQGRPFGYTVRFGLTGDAIHIHYLRVGRAEGSTSPSDPIISLSWETEVYELGQNVPDGLYVTTWPVNPAPWRYSVWSYVLGTLQNPNENPDPEKPALFELILPLNKQCP